MHLREVHMGLIAGLDEVGMGCLAGPIVVAVAAFPEKRVRIAGVTDSKRLSWQKLNELAPVISEEAAWIGWGFSSPAMIDELGVAYAWNAAAAMALENSPEFIKLIVDGTRAVEGFVGTQEILVKADLTHWQVSAASIIAKVLRDNEMIELAEHYPNYGWASNVGYGSDEHRMALLKHGATPHHRAHFCKKIFNPKPKKNKKPSRFKK
jgi:ribonuclease HII